MKGTVFSRFFVFGTFLEICVCLGVLKGHSI